MKRSTKKMALGLKVAGAALTLLAVYGGVAGLGTGAAQAAGPEDQALAATSGATLDSPLSRTYSGIGVEIDGNVIARVMAGQPAHLAGLKSGDVIIHVEGEYVANLPWTELVRRIRGEKGVAVALTITRPSTGETFELEIVRAEINPDTVSYACPAEPVRGFGQVWRDHPEVSQLLGCPFTDFRRDEHATRAAVQTFEHGWMLWLETDTVANVDPIYIFYADNSSYSRFGDRPLADAHAYAPTEAGFYKVGDRFARVYWEEIGADGRQRLGRATAEARDSQGAFQEFEQGRMFWAGEADTIYLIYQGEFDVDGDGQTTWSQLWTSYEDMFEETAQK
jgi:hypothetical protein